ncbi:hypothetical protein RclHR1_04600005 [Rhizophagus clarus]|uniref:Uncharacterized protein n=1 Tax=Rhizophagus clarus TaxID=94130 RepID=A0A2Z6RVQ9_9GLOM|nr:hypothetical protein RclHR1_04600005 [Rhizophagus clarus]
MDSLIQDTLHSNPEWFFRHRKDDVFQTIRMATKGIILQNRKVFSELELDEQLVKTFLVQNKDVMQLMELPEVIQPPPRSPLLVSFIATLLGRFVKDNDTIENIIDQVPSTPRHPTSITPPATPLSRAQKNNQLPEHTPSSSKVVTFSNVQPQPVIPLKSSDIKKPLEQPQNTQNKKRKQEHLADN